MMTLKEAREASGLTQMELAQKSGVAQATISDIERGAIKSPSWDTAIRLALALNKEPQGIFPVPTIEESSATA